MVQSTNSCLNSDKYQPFRPKSTTFNYSHHACRRKELSSNRPFIGYALDMSRPTTETRTILVECTEALNTPIIYCFEDEPAGWLQRAMDILSMFPGNQIEFTLHMLKDIALNLHEINNKQSIDQLVFFDALRSGINTRHFIGVRSQ